MNGFILSSELVRTREELTRAVDTLVDLVKQFLNQKNRVEWGSKGLKERWK